MRFAWPLLLLFWLFAAAAGAQTADTAAARPAPRHDHVRYLVIDTSWPLNRVRFYPGEKFTFKLKDERGWYSGRIQWVLPHSVYVLDANIPLSEIRKVRLRKSGYWQQFSSLSSASLISGGMLFIVMGGINELKYDGGEYLAIAGAGAITLGTAWRLLQKRTYRLGGRHTLRSI